VDQTVQHLQAGVAQGASVAAWPARGAIEVPGTVPEPDGGLLGQRGEADRGGGAVGPDRPGGIGLRHGEAGQSGQRGHGRTTGGRCRR
jgi:hypothetical protein